MSKTARFVVIINDNVVWMESQALQFYERLFEAKNLADKYAQEKFSQKELFRIQNDFSIEILMVHDGENPQSFLKLDSSRLTNENLGAEKAICLKDIIYFNEEDLVVLFKRSEEIALQRKHDLIWVKAFAAEDVLTKTLKALNYEEFDFDETTENLEKQIYLRKKLR